MEVKDLVKMLKPNERVEIINTECLKCIELTFSIIEDGKIHHMARALSYDEIDQASVDAILYTATYCLDKLRKGEW